MKEIFILFIFFTNTVFVKAQSIDVSNLATFVMQNADSVYIAKDSVVYKLWYPEQGVLVSFIRSNSIKSAVKIANYNLFPVDFAEVYLSLSQVDSVKLFEDKALQSTLELKLQEWCNKKRSFEQYQYIENFDIWEKLKIKIILDYEKDCRGYFFNIKSERVLSNHTMRKILVFFQDD